MSVVTTDPTDILPGNDEEQDDVIVLVGGPHDGERRPELPLGCECCGGDYTATMECCGATYLVVVEERRGYFQ